MVYNIDKPIHSVIELKKAIDAGEIQRPNVLPMLTLTGETEIRSPLIEGWLILYTGQPKIGKTELLFQTILNWEEQHSILWFSEEGNFVWVEKLSRTPWSMIKNDFAFHYANEESSKQIQLRIKQAKPEVVVIDTIKLLGIEEENKASEIRQALKPFYNLAHKEHITIILVHHDRKEKGRFGNQISGSNSFPGSTDITLSIRRHSNSKKDTKRIVEVSGRADNSEFAYMLNENSGEMVILGDPNNLKSEMVKGRIIPALTFDPLTSAALRDIIVVDGKGEVSKAVLNKALNQMAEAGEIGRVPDISEGSMKRKTVYWIKKED